MAQMKCWRAIGRKRSAGMNNPFFVPVTHHRARNQRHRRRGSVSGSQLCLASRSRWWLETLGRRLL